jgi:hypothetical protein
MGSTPLLSWVRRALHPLIALLLLALLLGFMPRVAAARASDPLSLAEILDRAGTYVHQFEQDFFLIISDEDAVQTYQPRGGGPGRGVPPRVRQIRSEMLVVREDDTWLAVRNVLWVRDDPAARPQVIADSKGRLDQLLKDISPGQAARLRGLADEGARFNLGSIYRNFNVPTLALQLLACELQPRFGFTVAGRETVSGSPTVKIEFAERQSPTVIALNDKREVLSNGFAWVRDPDGAVLRTHLNITTPQTRDGPGIDVSVDVEYRRDAKLETWVPRRMDEEYVEAMTGGQRVNCSSTYSNYRRFETSGRLLIPE